MASNRDLLGDSDDDKDFAIRVNEAYAQRFAHNKQREALHRLEELKKRGYGGDSDSDESSEDEEEDEDGDVPQKTDLQFYEALTKVKKKDPSIYQKDAKLYDDADEEEEEEQEDKSEKKTKKKKQLYLKDVTARHLLEHGPEFDNEDENPKNPRTRVPKSYAEEQEELKRAFLLEAGNDENDSDDEGLLTVKKKSAEELRREKEEEREAIKEAEQRAKDADIAKKLNEYFGRDDDLDENERFLKSYLLNKGWIDKDQKTGWGYEDEIDVSQDEEELEKQDRFEADYNFRFEEGAGDQVLGHARFMEGSVRKKPNARKQQRENKRERLAQAEFERKEELKQLKNIKKREIMEKLEKIRQIAGVKDDEGNLLDEEDLEEEFDPEDYDRKMRKAFGDEYYGAEDPDENFEGYDLCDLEKPDFDAEDELLGLPKGWDGTESKGFAEAREKLKECRKLNDEAQVEDGDSEKDDVLEDPIITGEGEEEAEDMVIEGEWTSKNKKRRKEGISLREKLTFDKQLEEYYKLDYEDMIGDLPTRFKYREVTSNTYGLTAEEILMTDDKELNQYVSIKKLAPYRTEEWKPPKHHRFSQKKRKRIALLGVESKFAKGMKKSNSKSKGKVRKYSKETNGKVDSEQASVIPHSRLLAYGEVPNERKKQKKTHRQLTSQKKKVPRTESIK